MLVSAVITAKLMWHISGDKIRSRASIHSHPKMGSLDRGTPTSVSKKYVVFCAHWEVRNDKRGLEITAGIDDIQKIKTPLLQRFRLGSAKHGV